MCPQYLATWYKSLEGMYLNKSSKAVVANVGEGKKWPDTGMADDAQANAFVKVGGAAVMHGAVATPNGSVALQCC